MTSGGRVSVERILPPTFSELSPDDPPTIGGFRLRGRLGSGGMGTAFLAEADPDGEWVVIKVLREDLADNADFRARLGRELESLRRLQGPEAVRVLADDLTGDAPWFAMEYVEGQTLADRVRTVGPLQGNALSGFADDLAAQIDLIHEVGVTHRDIKPSNIVISPTGPRIIDFGIALVDERTAMTTSGVMVGTLGWASPEQVSGDRVGPAADVHAWGLSVLYAATGQPPFLADSAAALLYKVVHTRPDIPQGLPDALGQQIAAALRKDPGARPSMREIRQGRTDPPTRLEPTQVVGGTRIDTPQSVTTAMAAHSDTRKRSRGPLIALVTVLGIALAAVVGVGLSLAAARSQEAGEPSGSLSPKPAGPTPNSSATQAESAASQGSPSLGPAISTPPVLSVEDLASSTSMWQATWQRVTAEGIDPTLQSRIDQQLDGFTNDEPMGFIQAEPQDPSAFNSMPGVYEHTVELVPCPEPLLCLVKRGSVLPPGGASSVGILDTLVIDYTTGDPLRISDVISKSQLGWLASAADNAVAESGESYPGIDVSLDANYKQFTEFIPQDDGIRLYFGEYVVGPHPVEIFVPWSEPSSSDAAATTDTPTVGEALSYICGSVPAAKPALVATNSDAEAVRAIQTVIPWKFGYDPGPVDGNYGPTTIAAVQAMQSEFGLAADGQVGRATWSALQWHVCPGD